MGHLIIRLRKLKKDIKNMSEDELKNKRLDYLKDANQKLDAMPTLEKEEDAAQR